MLESTMLVISDDPSLLDTACEITHSIDELKLEILPGIDSAYNYDGWDRVKLFVIHLKRRGQVMEVTRLLRMIAAARRSVATIVVDDRYDADQSLTLLRLGVADYLAWPEECSRLAYLVQVLTVRARQSLPGSTGPASGRLAPVADLVAERVDLDDRSEATDRLLSQVRRVAPLDTTILLSGETGTGKTRLAQLIHNISPRKNEPFVVVNCGSLSPLTVESEIFGFVRSSSHSSERDRVGKFTEAGRGTLFLDEIDTLPLHVQSKLLRVVEDQTFEPVGSNRSQPVRARLLAASNRPLDQEVEAGRFRSDLFYRLNVIGFNLTPLRDRRGAIAVLVDKFIAEFSIRIGGEVEMVAEDALQVLEKYDWPGNVRELRNVIERAVALSQGRKIRIEDLPDTVTRAGAGFRSNAGHGHSTIPVPSLVRSTLAEIKRDAELSRITEALEKHSNNRLRAASELGISRMTLYKKLYKYGLMQPASHARDGVVA